MFISYFRLVIFFNKQQNMIGKFFNSPEDYYNGNTLQNKQTHLGSWRQRTVFKQQKKQLQKRLFGQHYNYSKIGLNKEKKYLIQQQKNTQIERSNRILLQKIQRISKRSVPVEIKKRALTQETDNEGDKRDSLYKFKDIKMADYESNLSQQQINKLDISNFKTARTQRKYLYRGTKQFEDQIYSIKIFIEKDKYNLQAQSERYRQNIKIDLENYQKLFQNYLSGDHARILDLLRHKGNIIELVGVKRQQITIQEKQQLTLPQIGSHNKESNQKKEDFWQ